MCIEKIHRGQVKSIRSDNGTNFTGAEKELRECIRAWNTKQINDAMLQRNIQWNFNPPAGSHFGGVWERLIRSVRKLLNSVPKEQTLNEEGLRTLLCEIENTLNDRPITKVPNQHNDLEALTPNHLLLMKKHPNLSPGIFSKEDSYSHRRWRQVQYLFNTSLTSFGNVGCENICHCQERQKWHVVKRNLQIGDVVLVIDERSLRNSWPLGRIIELQPDRHGLVRQVKLKTKSVEMIRPIDKLCLILEGDLDD